MSLTLEHTIAIAASPERVWAVTLDIESWPRWTPTMETITRLDEGPFRYGSKARIKQPGLPETVWTVSAFDPAARCFVWRSRVRGLNFAALHEVSPGPRGARNLLSVEVTGLLAYLLWPILKGPLAHALEQENAGLKRYIEQADTP